MRTSLSREPKQTVSGFGSSSLSMPFGGFRTSSLTTTSNTSFMRLDKSSEAHNSFSGFPYKQTQKNAGTATSIDGQPTPILPTKIRIVRPPENHIDLTGDSDSTVRKDVSGETLTPIEPASHSQTPVVTRPEAPLRSTPNPVVAQGHLTPTNSLPNDIVSPQSQGSSMTAPIQAIYSRAEAEPETSGNENAAHYVTSELSQSEVTENHSNPTAVGTQSDNPSGLVESIPPNTESVTPTPAPESNQASTGSARKKGKKREGKKSSGKPRKRGDWRVQNYNNSPSTSAAPGYYYSGPHDPTFQIPLNGPAPGYSVIADTVMKDTQPQAIRQIDTVAKGPSMSHIPAQNVNNTKQMHDKQPSQPSSSANAPKIAPYPAGGDPRSIASSSSNRWTAGDANVDFEYINEDAPDMGDMMGTGTPPGADISYVTVLRRPPEEQEIMAQCNANIRSGTALGGNVREERAHRNYSVTPFPHPNAEEGSNRSIPLISPVPEDINDRRNGVGSSGFNTNRLPEEIRDPVTVVIEDRRPARVDESIAEIDIPLRVLEPGMGWRADAQDICSALQSGPSRIDGMLP